jgi:hypothetical protein
LSMFYCFVAACCCLVLLQQAERLGPPRCRPLRAGIAALLPHTELGLTLLLITLACCILMVCTRLSWPVLGQAGRLGVCRTCHCSSHHRSDCCCCCRPGVPETRGTQPAAACSSEKAASSPKDASWNGSFMHVGSQPKGVLGLLHVARTAMELTQVPKNCMMRG